MRSILFILFSLMFIGVQAQERRYDRAVSYYEDGKYYKAYKQLDKALKHKDTRSRADVLLLQAKVLLKLTEDEFFLEDEPKALYNSMKLADKALAKSKDQASLREKESTFFQELAEKALEAANEELANQKYIQANKYFEKLYEINGDLRAKWGEGRVALALNDTNTVIEKAKEVSAALLEQAKAGETVLVEDKPFLFVINHYIDQKRYDTAAFISRNAYIIYPESKSVKNLLLQSFLLDVTSRRPQLETLEAFATMRPIFKDDSLFLHKENVLFLYLLNLHAAQPDIQHITDSLLSGYFEVKNAYFADQGEAYKKKDILFDQNNQEKVFNVLRYAAKAERSALLSAMLRNYVGGTYADSAYRAKKESDRWKLTFDRMQAENSIYLLAHALPEAEKVLRKEKWFPAFKLQLVQESLNKQAKFKDRTALVDFIPFALESYPRSLPVFKSAEALSRHLVAEFMDSAYWSYAKVTLKQHDFYFPDGKEIQALKRSFTERDFMANYFGSRLLKVEKNGKQVSEFEWTGNELLCQEGRVPDAIQAKVAQRINYFRRSAGVPDYVYLDTTKNAACQKAALIYQVNDGKLFTSPAETWKCYSLSAVDAAQFSARVFGQTTVFAVTTLMADKGDKNTWVGNRRWMLYPASRVMGHGSTNETALIWTLDNTGQRDTSEYMTDFVSWPPRDYCPQMFAFDRWNFSIYADLSKAKVKVLLNGKPVNIHQEALVSGYGMPSLVWEVKDAIVPEQTYTVVIEGVRLHGEKTATTFKYPVTFIDPMKKER
ncbi:MAG: hypothetical protein EP332_13175 [Bacteroidetes bacterium]|nr:MAG: hypothetical protein EP332_13175 [Bacteroidota bacterium]